MSQFILGREIVAHKIVFEIRYRDGHTYLDRCGRLLKQITAEMPQWITTSEPSAQNAQLMDFDSRTALSFNSQRTVLILERKILDESLSPDEIVEFAANSFSIETLIQSQLAYNDIARVGCRIWFVVPAESKVDSEEFRSRLGVFDVDRHVVEQFGTIESASITIVAEGEDRMYRVAINGVERTSTVNLGNKDLEVDPKMLSSGQRKAFIEKVKARAAAKRASRFATMIDFDCYQEDPIETNVADFISTSYVNCLEKIKRVAKKEVT